MATDAVASDNYHRCATDDVDDGRTNFGTRHWCPTCSNRVAVCVSCDISHLKCLHQLWDAFISITRRWLRTVMSSLRSYPSVGIDSSHVESIRNESNCGDDDKEIHCSLHCADVQIVIACRRDFKRSLRGFWISIVEEDAFYLEDSAKVGTKQPPSLIFFRLTFELPNPK